MIEVQVSEPSAARAEARVPFRYEGSVVVVRMPDLGALSASMDGEELRRMLESVEEEMHRAASEHGASMIRWGGGEFGLVFGVPRDDEWHALRGVMAGLALLPRLMQLRAGLESYGCRLPECSVGMHSGPMFAVSEGDRVNSGRAVGVPFEVARRLAGMVRGWRFLATEETLQRVQAKLPEGWGQATERVEDPGVEGMGWPGTVALDPELCQRVVVLGASGADGMIERTAEFRYRRALAAGGETGDTIVEITAGSDEGRGSLSAVELGGEGGEEQFFGPFRLIRRLGVGGMGEVWLARDRFGTMVALKRLIAGLAQSDAQLQRLRREAEVMSRLRHPNICQVFEMGDVGGIEYLAMEYLEGVTLADVLDPDMDLPAAEFGFTDLRTDVGGLVKRLQSRPSGAEMEADGAFPATRFRTLPLAQTMTMMIKACAAVAFAHERGILHRDLKPGNIMIRPDGEPILMDFGLAKMETGRGEMSLSISGQMMGTLDYMAPEQARSTKDVTERADVYSLGAILYQMITGQKHFQPTGNLLADAQKLQEHVPVHPASVNAMVDQDLALIVLKALQPDPSDRYRNVAMLKDDLIRYSRGEPIMAKPMPVGELLTRLIRRNRGVAMAAAAGIAALVASSTLFVFSLKDSIRRLQVANQEARTSQERAEVAMRQAEDALKKERDSHRLAEQRRREAEAARTMASKAEERAKEERAAAEQATVASREIEERLRATQGQLADRTASIEEVRRNASRAHLAWAREALLDLDLKEAAARLAEAAEIAPDLADVFMMRARLHLMMLDFEAAAGELEAIKRMDWPADSRAAAISLESVIAKGFIAQRNAPGGVLPRTTFDELSAELKRSAQFDDRVVATYWDTAPPAALALQRVPVR